MNRWFRRIAWLEPFWVLAVAPILLLPGRFIPAALAGSVDTWQPFALLILGLGWPIRWLAYGRPTRLTPITIPILLILAWLPVNYWAAADKQLALDALGFLLFGVALYFAFLNWPPTSQQPLWLAWFLILMGLGLSLAAPFLSNLALSSLFQIPNLAPTLERLAELTPGNVSENRMAGTLVILLPLYLALLFNRRQSRLLRLLSGATAAIIILLLLLSQSRGALLAGFFGILVMLLLRRPRLLPLILVIVLIAGVGLSQLGPEAFLEAQSSDNPVGGLDVRLEIWNRALYALADFPFTGIGIGNHAVVIPVLYPYFLIPPELPVEHSHNIFTQVAVDLGFPGLVAYLAIHINTVALLWPVLRCRDGSDSWSLAVGVSGGLAAMFGHGLIDAPVWGAKPAFVAWLLLALAVLSGLHAEKHLS